MFNDKYGLTQAVLDCRKTMTRREPIFFDGNTFQGIFDNRIHLYEESTEKLLHKSYYSVGEVVAIAQSYKDIFNEADKGDYWADCYEAFRQFNTTESKGYSNKMFVRADLMPHHIRITDIKVERLQDCSDNDILKEGVFQISAPIYSHYNGIGYTFKGWTERGVECSSDTPKGAFKALIDKTCGRGTFESNPYVFAYSFKLLD